MAKQSKDHVLSLNIDIIREMKENEEYARSEEGKKRLKLLEEQLEDTKEILEGMGIKEEDIPENVEALQNEINMLKGDDYWFTVSDGFEDYRLKKSAIEKMGDSVAPYILARWKDNISDELDKIVDDKKLSKQYKDKYKDIFSRLMLNIKRNISLIRKQETYKFYDKLLARANNEPYPIFQDVVATNIRINI
jgi:hypothetical protein